MQVWVHVTAGILGQVQVFLGITDETKNIIIGIEPMVADCVADSWTFRSSQIQAEFCLLSPKHAKPTK